MAKFLNDIIIQGKDFNTSLSHDKCDISTWQIHEDEFYSGSQESNGEAIFFKPDGTKMYIAGRSGDDVNEYALSTAWDVTTASFTDTLDGLESSPASESNPYDMYISPDGIYLYIVGHTTDQVIQYTMSTAWDISTASYTREQDLVIANGNDFNDPIGINFKSDGTMFWVVSQNSDAIQQYTLSTAWDVSTLSVGHFKTLTGGFFTLINFDESENNYNLGSIESIWVSEDGTKVWLSGSSYDTIHQLKLSTPFNITTATYDGSTIRATAVQGDNGGLYVNEAVGKAFTVAPSADFVRYYNFGGLVFNNDNEGGVGFKNGVGVNGSLTVNGIVNLVGRTSLYFADVHSTFTTYGTTSLTASNGGTVNIIDGTTYTTAGTLDVLTNVHWGRNNIDQNPYTNGIIHNINLGRPRKGGIINLNIGRRQAGSVVNGSDNQGVVNIVSKAQTFTHDGYLTVGQKLQVTGNADLQVFDLGGTVIFSDTFTETNTTDLASHTPDTGAGWTKVFDSGTAQAWNVIGGTGVAQASVTDSSDGMIYLCDTLPTVVDYEIKVDFLRKDSGDDTFHIIFKYKDADNFFHLQWSASYSSYCKLRRKEGGSFVEITNFDYGVNNSTTDNQASSLKVRFIDNKIMVWDIDSNGYQAYRGSYVVTDFTNDGNGGTFHKFGMGIGAIDGGSHDQTNTWKIDKFEVKQLSSAATLANSTQHYILNGNVGIGTTDPAYARLQVAGTTLFQGASQIQGDLSLRGNVKDLNKAASAFLTTKTRNTSGSELALEYDYVKSFNATSGGDIAFGGNTTLPNAKIIKFENSVGNAVEAMTFNSSNELVICNGNSANGSILFKDGGVSGFTNLTIDGLNDKVVVAGELEASSLDINGTVDFDQNLNAGAFVDHKNSNAGSAAYTSIRIQSDVGNAEIWRNSSTRTQTGGAAQSLNIYNTQDTNLWSGATRALNLNSSQNATFAGDARFNERVRVGDVTGLSNRGAVRIDTRGDAPADLLFGRDTAGTATSWNGVYWSLSSRGSAEGNAFKIYRGGGHSSPYNSEAVPFMINPDLSATFAGTISTPHTLYFTNNNAIIKVGSNWNTGTLSFLNGATTYLQFDVPNGRIQNNLGSYLTASSGTAKFGSFDNQSMSLVTNNTARLTVDTSGNATFTKDIVLSQGSYYFRNASDSTQRHGFVADHVYEFNQLDLQINATRKLYFDGGSDTYIYESSANDLDFYAGGTRRLRVNANGIESAANVYSGTNSSFRNYAGDWTATIGTTNKKFNFYNTADSLTCMSLSHTGDLQVTGDIRNINSYQQGTVSAANPAMKAVLLAHSTESNGAVIHPYLFNDLANFRKRGGTITYGGLSSNPSDAASDLMFHASALTNSISNSNITGSTWTIELKDFPRTLFYGTRIGISFGSVSFAPSSMLVQYSSDNGANYTTALTSSIRNEYYHTYVANGGSGSGINAIKFTIGKFNTYSPRVMNIYAYNYDSRGMTEYFLDKAGGALYGNLSMHSSGFSLDGNTITGIDNASEFTDDDAHIMTSAAIKNKIADNDNNFITASSLPTDFVSAANGGTFASNVSFTGNITANGNISGDHATNIGAINKISTKEIELNNDNSNATLTVANIANSTVRIGRLDTITAGTNNNDGTNVVVENHLTVEGKLTVKGDVVTESTSNTVIKDNIIQLNGAVEGSSPSANTSDIGVVMDRGTSTSVALQWDESENVFQLVATGSDAGSAALGVVAGGGENNDENVAGTANAKGWQTLYAGKFRAMGSADTSGFTGNGAGVTNLNMGNASSGTLAAARGGTGITTFSNADYKNSNVTSVTGSSGSCTGNAATATAFSTTLGLTTVSMTFQLAANTWTDTGINSSDLASGTYAMQVFVDDHYAGGLHFDEYYSATISWFGGTTNSSNHDEIVTHNAGHANNNSHLQFRTLRHTNPGDNLMLQVKQNFAHSLALNGTDGKTMTFKFRRLI